MEPDGTIYDAGQIVLRYSGLPGHDWHPAPLLRVLADSSAMAAPISPLEFNSSRQRRVAVTTAAARLGERGYPIEDLVRSVFGRQQVGEFVRLSCRVAYDLGRGVREVPGPLRHLGDSLLVSTAVAASEDEAFFDYFRRVLGAPEAGRFVNKAAGWVQTAELRALLTWAVPTAEAWDEVPEVDIFEADDAATWLADRFLLNAVDHWATSSLHLEYRWANGEVPVEVDPSEITLRSLQVDKLNAEIARRAVTGEKGEYHKNLLNRSVELLEARRFSDAVSLFEAALALSPTLWVRNCLAFCLIPQEPMFAVHMLVELLDEGFHPPLVRANLAAASRLCGAVEEARVHAAAGLAALEGRPQSSAFLWRFGESEVVLAEVDLERYLRNALTWSDPGPLGTSDQ